MPNLVSISALVTALMASSSLALPTKANSLEVKSNSEIALEQTGIISEQKAPSSNLNSETLASANLSSSNNFNDWSKKIVGLTGLAIGSGVIAYQLASKNSTPLANFTQNQTKGLLLDRVSPKLRQKLLRLAHNPQTANRLLTGTMLAHQDRSPNWLAEKVIYDLERDRR